MNKLLAMAAIALVFLTSSVNRSGAQDAPNPPAETRIDGLEGSTEIVRMQGPYDAEVPLQVVCYFKRTASSDSRMAGAPVELDKHLGGLIASLRSRGEFDGEELETILFDVPEGAIKPKRLLLIGLGDESSLSLERMERVGRVALREAVKVGATKVAFAPLIRDQGNTQIATGDVENAVTRGVLLAYDTEKRLQKQGFARPYTLEEWVVEAGPKYYDETVAGVKKAVGEARVAASKRESTPYSNKSR
ncbi:MAG: M17 family peptidase N-terminal domain-containing protein [Paludisphaera borealis]|uniref:M17 family peptidase N-terminal domain-containing protein n=1 Tax=Paludisphaera borealis TaxID=1387353 RepID=UPI00284FEEFB|nr:M17 family peptidase N-terminal domain-containing protein [Paludisphaera borealis]MDR3618249.1 M17 family peptidase N-terminal domain-containing protein [Paludisphaera borealis]